ncbi:MAG: hypothetical protein ACO3LE_10285, partial [Bdellovibrionota bacterium]
LLKEISRLSNSLPEEASKKKIAPSPKLGPIRIEAPETVETQEASLNTSPSENEDPLSEESAALPESTNKLLHELFRASTKVPRELKEGSWI